MGIDQQHQAQGAKRAAVAAALLTIALPGVSAAQSQTPSGGFDLRPGAPAEAPPSNVQGPVDAESPPPRQPEQTPAPTPAPAVVTPVPIPQVAPPPVARPRERAPAANTPARPRTASPDARPTQTTPEAAVVAPLPESPLPAPEPIAPEAVTPGGGADETPAPPPISEPIATDAPEQSDGSIWLWLAAGLVALVALITMAMRSRAEKQSSVDEGTAQAVPVVTVPTPPLRAPPAPSPPPPPPPAPVQPRMAPVPQPAETPAPAASFANAPPQAERPPASDPTPTAPRLLLDYTTLGVDVTLVNAVARYHLAVTNMSDIAVTDVVLHGAVVQARRGMPPTIDPMLGDTMLPKLQAIADIDSGATQRCEGQIRLPLAQIEPIAMQGRLLFVPVVHIWIGYSGPDGSRYAVTQSFVLGEENTPPGPRVGPLRLDLGPRRFTGIGQRPLQPA